MADDLARLREAQGAAAQQDRVLYEQNWAVVDEVVRDFWSTIRAMNIPPQHVVDGFTDRGTGWDLRGPLRSRANVSIMVRQDGSWTMDVMYGGDLGPDLHIGSSDGHVVAWNSRIDRDQLRKDFVARLAELEDRHRETGAAWSPDSGSGGLGSLGNSLGGPGPGSFGNGDGSGLGSLGNSLG